MREEARDIVVYDWSTKCNIHVLGRFVLLHILSSHCLSVRPSSLIPLQHLAS